MDRREQVLAAARKVFAREGFNGATMEAIAAEAELKTPSHLYWYFKNKKELLQAVVEDLSPVLRNLSEFWEKIDDPPEEVLGLLVTRLISTLDNQETVQLIRIFLSEAPRIPETANAFAEKMILALNFIVAYLEHQMDKGTLIKHDAQSSSRALIGSFLIYMLGSEIFLPFRAGLPDKETYAKEILRIFLHGIQADDNSRNMGAG